MKFTVPGYKYLGPGNKLKSGKPVNKLDAAAEKHDYGYAYANSASDVDRADEQFESEAWREGLLGNAAASSIHLKSAVERNIFGQHLYPWQQYKGPQMAPAGGTRKQGPRAGKARAPSGERSRSPIGSQLDTPPETPRKGGNEPKEIEGEGGAVDAGNDPLVGVGASSAGVAGGSSAVALQHLGLPRFIPSKSYPLNFRYNRTRNMILTQNLRAVGPQINFLFNFGCKEFRQFVASHADMIRRCDTLFLHSNTMKIDARQNMQAHVVANSFDLQTREGNIGAYNHIHYGAYGIPAHTATLGYKNADFLNDSTGFMNYKKLTIADYDWAKENMIGNWDSDFWQTVKDDGTEFIGVPVLVPKPRYTNLSAQDFAVQYVPWANDPLKHMQGPWIGYAKDVDEMKWEKFATNNPWMFELGKHDNLVRVGNSADPETQEYWPFAEQPSEMVGSGGTTLNCLADWVQGLRHPDIQENGKNYPRWKQMTPSSRGDPLNNKTNYIQKLDSQDVFEEELTPSLYGQSQIFWGHDIGQIQRDWGGKTPGYPPQNIDNIRGLMVPWQGETGGQRPLETWTPIIRDNTPQGFTEGNGGEPMEFNIPNKVRLPLKAIYVHVFYNLETAEQDDPVSTSELAAAVSCMIPTNTPNIPWHLVPLRKANGEPTKQNWRNLDIAGRGVKQYKGMYNRYWDKFTLPPWLGIYGERCVGDLANADQQPRYAWSGFFHVTPPTFLNPGATTKDNGLTMTYNTTGPEMYYDFIGAPATFDISGKKLLGEYQNYRCMRTMGVDFNVTCGDRFVMANNTDEFKYQADYQEGHGKGYEIWPLRCWQDGQINSPSQGSSGTSFQKLAEVKVVLPL